MNISSPVLLDNQEDGMSTERLPASNCPMVMWGIFLIND